MRRRYGDEMLVEVVRTRFYGHLFHATDEANLGSIEQNGILSARRALEMGVEPVNPGGSALTRHLDVRSGVDDQVFLSFFNRGIMPKHDDARFRRPVVLKIAAEALFLRGVKVALGRANQQNTRIYGPSAAYYKMDWDVIFGDPEPSDLGGPARIRRALDYEILVPDCVPTEYILGIA